MLGLVVLQIILLSLLRNRLVFEFQSVSLLLFGNTRIGLWFYTILFLPGTVIHELSHWIVAEILQVQTGAITIFPDFEAENHVDRQRLGSVATAKSDPFRGFLIGIAPFVTGTLALFVLSSLLRDGWNAGWIWWKLGLIIYGLIVVASSMLISREDRRYWPAIIILGILTYLALWKSGVTVALSPQSWFVSAVRNINLIFVLTIGLDLLIIGSSYGIRRIIEGVTGKRIIRR